MSFAAGTCLDGYYFFVLIQIEAVDEHEIRLCPYMCQDCKRLTQYCEEAEHNHVEEFHGDVLGHTR